LPTKRIPVLRSVRWIKMVFILQTAFIGFFKYWQTVYCMKCELNL